jgi:hypothetical protein
VGVKGLTLIQAFRGKGTHTPTRSALRSSSASFGIRKQAHPVVFLIQSSTLSTIPNPTTKEGEKKKKKKNRKEGETNTAAFDGMRTVHTPDAVIESTYADAFSLAAQSKHNVGAVRYIAASISDRNTLGMSSV